MPTEEDLKSIIVHKKYSSSGKNSKGRKRKRSSSSEASAESESGGEERREKDVGFVPSRFLKGSSSSNRKSRTSRTRHDRTEDEDFRKRREQDRSREERGREERVRDSTREERPREERSRDDRSRDERDRTREERPPREERSRGDDRTRDDRDRSRDRPREDRDRATRDQERSRDVRDYKDRSRDDRVREDQESRYRKDLYNRREPEPAPRRGRETDDSRRRQSNPGRGGRGRKGDWKDDDEDYDPISDEELAMLEEDAGVVEIYKTHTNNTPAAAGSKFRNHCQEIEREMRSKRYSANVDHIDFSVLKVLKPKREMDKDPLSVLASCGYSATFGGRALTDKIKSLAAASGKEISTQGAYLLEKKSVDDICRETLSPHVALSSFTDNLLRHRLATREKHVSQIVVDENVKQVPNPLLAEATHTNNTPAAAGSKFRNYYQEIEREMRSKRYSANVDHIDFSVLKVLKPKREMDKDPLSVLASCGYSATFGGRALTDKIKSLAAASGKEISTQGAYLLEKKSVDDICRETLSPHVALSSFTDNLLRHRLATREKHVSQIVVDENVKQVPNPLLAEAVKLFNKRAGTSLEIKTLNCLQDLMSSAGWQGA
eukprot:sb/3479548/